MRSIARPARFVDTTMPSIIGTSSRPASVGLAPVVVCRYSGTKTLTANSEAVVRNNAIDATATVRVRSRSSGTTGSAARRSRAISAPASSAAPASRATIVAESQA